MTATTIASDHIVAITYKLTDADSGEVLDESGRDEPLQYLHGHGQLVDGLEAALDGKASGFGTTITLAAADAYGDRDEERVITVPKDRFSEMPEIGQVVQASGPDGHAFRLKVSKIEDDSITLDGNHPLAGRRLTFEVEVTDVRAATEHELSHGHAHCGHDHGDHGCGGHGEGGCGGGHCG